MAEFLKLPKGGDQMYSKQKELCRADESRPKGEEVSVSLVCACSRIYVYICVLIKLAFSLSVSYHH